MPSQHPLCRWHYTPNGIWQPVNPTNKLEGACSMWGIKWYILNKVPVEKSQQLRPSFVAVSLGGRWYQTPKQDWLPGQLGGWKCRLGPPWYHKILESHDLPVTHFPHCHLWIRVVDAKRNAPTQFWCLWNKLPEVNLRCYHYGQTKKMSLLDRGLTSQIDYRIQSHKEYSCIILLQDSDLFFSKRVK